MTTTELPPAPAAIRALAAIPDPDYADTFTIEAPDATRWNAEQWARVCFDEVAGSKAWLLWRFVLGLRLKWRRSSPETICGWRIGGRGADWIRLEAKGRRIHGNLILRVTDGRAQLATIARFTHPRMVAKWERLKPTHNGVVPGLMTETLALLRSRD